MQRQLLVVMGPSGAGKSRIATSLAAAIIAPMFEGDDYHPASNRKKMAAGEALTDEDRSHLVNNRL
ncbi:MAG: hypothetical protein AAGK02_11115 [Pseudomonadota bacterium]